MLLPFEVVVARHGAAVLRVVRAGADPSDADDAWSETFLAALRACPWLPPDANVEAWLVTIARRKVVDLHRARARRAVPVAAIAEVPETVEPVATFDLDLVAAVAHLPPKQRACVAHHHLAGLPYGDVAALVGGTPAAAPRRRRRHRHAAPLRDHPVPLVVPCHRVVRSHGSPGAYRGGTEAKRVLLALEQAWTGTARAGLRPRWCRAGRRRR